MNRKIPTNNRKIRAQYKKETGHDYQRRSPSPKRSGPLPTRDIVKILLMTLAIALARSLTYTLTG